MSCIAWVLNDSSTLVYGETNRWINTNVGMSKRNGHVEIAMASDDLAELSKSAKRSIEY